MVGKLRQLPNCPTVFIGGNYVATHLGVHKLQAQQRHAAPACNAAATAQSQTNQAQLCCANTGKQALPNARQTAVVKLHRHVPHKPTLGESLRSSLHMVSSRDDAPLPQQLTFDGMDHAKLEQVFGKLQSEIDSWKALADDQTSQAIKVDNDLAQAVYDDEESAQVG